MKELFGYKYSNTLEYLKIIFMFLWFVPIGGILTCFIKLGEIAEKIRYNLGAYIYKKLTLYR